MQRSLYSAIGISILACGLLCAQASVRAQVPITSDSTEVPRGTLNIKIDERGIRIQGEGDDTERQREWDRTPPRRHVATDLVKFGEDVEVGPDDLVNGDIVVFGGDVTIEGKVIGNVVVIGGDVDAMAGAEINGDVVVLGGVLEEGPEVIIRGERVMIKEINFSIQRFLHPTGSRGRFFAFFFIPIQFFVSIILSFLVILFIRERMERSHEHLQQSFLKSFGAGFLVVFVGSFVVALLVFILCITLIGIPLAIGLIISCGAVFLISRTVFVYALGTRVNEILKIETVNPFAIVTVGTAALYVPALLGYGVSLWPLGGGLGAVLKFVGILISVFAYLVGLGALVLSRFGARGAGAESFDPATPALD